jgi:hypothetical protein
MNFNIAGASDCKLHVDKLQGPDVWSKWTRGILVLFIVGVVETVFVV